MPRSLTAARRLPRRRRPHSSIAQTCDLALHSLKGFEGATRVCQLGAGDFAPLRSPGSVDLPTPATPFLGRQHELFGALSVVFEKDPRILSIVGPGGTGKTRFAIELGLTDKAENSGRNALALARRLADRRMSLYALTSLALCALQAMDLSRAGTLWGVVLKEEREDPILVLDPQFATDTALLAGCEDRSFREGLESGRTMGFESAVGLALGEAQTLP